MQLPALVVVPPWKYWPFPQVTHAVWVLEPSHAWFAEQPEQVVRVFESPPLVNEPVGQVLQLDDAAAAYFLSLLHASEH